MARFYGTFMQKQAFKNLYVEIEAENKELARECMFDHFGYQFSTVYTEEKFDGQVEQFRLKSLCSIQVIDHGSSIEYRLLSI